MNCFTVFIWEQAENCSRECLLASLQSSSAALQDALLPTGNGFSENPEICTYNQPLRHVLSFSTSSPHTRCSRQSHSQELWIINHNNSFSIASQGRGRISTSLAYCICHSPLAWFIRCWRWRHQRAEVGHLGTPRCTVPGRQGPDIHDVSQLRAHHYFSTMEHVRYFVEEMLPVSHQQGQLFCKAARVTFKY